MKELTRAVKALPTLSVRSEPYVKLTDVLDTIKAAEEAAKDDAKPTIKPVADEPRKA